MVRIECGSCIHYLEQSEKKGSCVRNPPIPFPFVQGSVVGGKPHISLMSFFPPVDTGMICGEFEINTDESSNDD
jgi:hypothetical protein